MSRLPSINEIVADLWRSKIIREMPREELKKRMTRYGDVEITSTPEEHKRAEEFVNKQIEERTGVKQSDYSWKLKQHPNQRILEGDNKYIG